jgi:GAF domain-containing protein
MLPDFRVRQRDYLLEIARLLTEELDLDKLLARILKIAIEMLAGQAGLIALKESEGWRVATAHNIPPAFLSYLTPLLAEEKVAELDVAELNRMLKDLTYTASMGLLNGTGIALAAHGQVIGVIFIFRNYADLFSANDKALLGSFAAQAAIAVYNARLYREVNFEKQRLDALLDSAADHDPQCRLDHRTRQRRLRAHLWSDSRRVGHHTPRERYPLGARPAGHHP